MGFKDDLWLAANALSDQRRQDDREGSRGRISD